jgi:hypothetical protein
VRSGGSSLLVFAVGKRERQIFANPVPGGESPTGFWTLVFEIGWLIIAKGADRYPDFNDSPLPGASSGSF